MTRIVILVTAMATSRDPGRRRRILDVARVHFARNGFKGTRLSDVAEEAGCAKGALYLDFPDKEALLMAVATEVMEGAGRRFVESVVSLPSPLERLRETVRFAFREMAREPLFARLMRDDPELTALRPASARAEQAKQVEGQLALMRAWVKEGIDKGEIRADTDVEAMPFVIALLKALPPHAEAATAGLYSSEKLLDAIVTMFERSLAAPSLAAPEKTNRRRRRRRRRRRV